MTGHRRALVAVPARDEEDHIGACLLALTQAQTRKPDGVVVAVNNTTDGTERVVRALLPRLPVPVPVHVLVHDFPPESACAGAARRLATEHAAALLGADPSGVLLTTDADAIVPPGWLDANLRELEGGGADAVLGRAVLHRHEEETIPARLREDDARECALAAALDELASLLDPEPWDPWPRHAEHSGASIAVTLPAYRLAGGMPAAPLAEDRLFVAALRRVDARIRHHPGIAVAVSARTVGRAEGGMADTIRRRLHAADPYLDTALEPATDFARRLRVRRRFREAFFGTNRDPEALAASLAVSAGAVRDALARPFFGEGWAELEACSPHLHRRPVPAARATAECDAARALIAGATRADPRKLTASYLVMPQPSVGP